MKKSLSLAVMGAVLVANPVFASGGDYVRSETETKVNGETKLEVSVNQNANVKNVITEKINTGENEASHNTACCDSEKGTGDVSITTGSASGTVNIENNVNKTNVEIGEKEEEEEEEKPVEEKPEEEGESPAEVEVQPSVEGAAAAEVGPAEVSGQLAAETLPETGANNIGFALLLSAILLLAGYDLKKFFKLKKLNLI